MQVSGTILLLQSLAKTLERQQKACIYPLSPTGKILYQFHFLHEAQKLHFPWKAFPMEKVIMSLGVLGEYHHQKVAHSV